MVLVLVVGKFLPYYIQIDQNQIDISFGFLVHIEMWHKFDNAFGALDEHLDWQRPRQKAYGYRP
jgi:hypothetical protein